MDRAERPSSPVRQPRLLALAAGVGLTLIGLSGDLFSRVATSGDHREELLSFGRGADGWHFVLFVGIVVTAGAAAAVAFDLGTRVAKVTGTAMTALAVAVVLLGALAAVKATWAPTTIAEPRVEILPAPVQPASATTTHAHTGHAGHAGAAEGEGGAVFGHQHGKPGPVTAAERVVLRSQLAAAKRATAKYRNIEVAKRDGFFQVTQYIPGLGMHMIDLGRSSAAFDPARPQILLYMPVGGREVLAGVAYSFIHVLDTPPAGFAGGSDVWHFHRDLCFTNGTVTVTTSKADCPGVFQAETNWLLHAWIWKHNPGGVFTEYNPRLR